MRKNTTQEFILKAQNKHFNFYDYSQVEYISNDKNVIIICPEHGKFQQLPRAHLVGQGCKKCGDQKKGKSFLKTTSIFIEQAKQIHGDKYSFEKTCYKNTYEKIIITCKQHGDFTSIPKSILRGHGCSECAGVKKLSIDDFVKKANKVHNNYYDYSIVEYKNINSSINIICPKHGIFKQKPNTHINGKCGCPQCKFSKGELLIKNYLDRNNIEYEYQKTFILCVGKQNNKLKFDFYLPLFNLCIEFDGYQHYGVVTKFGGEKTLNRYKQTDSIKNDFCKNNNIDLLRIPYWKLRFSTKVLDEKLCKIKNF